MTQQSMMMGNCRPIFWCGGILLSKRFSELILVKGSVRSHIVWVHIDGPCCPLFIIYTYIPGKYRTTNGVQLTTDVLK